MPEGAATKPKLRPVQYGDSFLEALLAEAVATRKVLTAIKKDVRAIKKKLDE